jgi:hypothetical protein
VTDSINGGVNFIENANYEDVLVLDNIFLTYLGDPAIYSAVDVLQSDFTNINFTNVVIKAQERGRLIDFYESCKDITFTNITDETNSRVYDLGEGADVSNFVYNGQILIP